MALKYEYLEPVSKNKTKKKKKSISSFLFFTNSRTLNMFYFILGRPYNLEKVQLQSINILTLNKQNALLSKIVNIS